MIYSSVTCIQPLRQSKRPIDLQDIAPNNPKMTTQRPRSNLPTASDKHPRPKFDSLCEQHFPSSREFTEWSQNDPNVSELKSTFSFTLLTPAVCQDDPDMYMHLTCLLNGSY